MNSAIGAVRANTAGRPRRRWEAARCGTERCETDRWGPDRYGSGRWGPYRWQPLDLWKTSVFWPKLAAFSAVMAMLSLSVPAALASPLVDSFSGTSNGVAPTTGTVSSFSLDGGSPINTPVPTSLLSTGGFDASAATPMTVNVSSFNDITTLGATVSDLILTNGSDTVDFTLSDVGIKNYSIPVTGSLFFNYGIITAAIPVGGVLVTGPDKTELQNELLNFTENGGGLFLTYNGINIVSGDATIGTSPSSSFTVVAGLTPSAPEPTAAILSLSGAAAIILAKLARQLRRKNLIPDDESPDS
jgi:hypothetical protein